MVIVSFKLAILHSAIRRRSVVLCARKHSLESPVILDTFIHCSADAVKATLQTPIAHTELRPCSAFGSVDPHCREYIWTFEEVCDRAKPVYAYSYIQRYDSMFKVLGRSHLITKKLGPSTGLEAATPISPSPHTDVIRIP